MNAIFQQYRYTPAMPTPPKAKKWDQILDTALRLFNTHGSQKVTTNHIAAELGISPGNLYYHFKNKTHIIRELLGRLIAAFDQVIQTGSGIEGGLSEITVMLGAVGDLIHTYRFIYVELAALLSQDTLFAAMYRETKTRRTKQFAQLFHTASRQGLLKSEIAPAELEDMVFLLWTYVEGMVTALHSSGYAVTRENIHTQLKKSLYLFKSYLHPPLWEELARQVGLNNRP